MYDFEKGIGLGRLTIVKTKEWGGMWGMLVEGWKEQYYCNTLERLLESYSMSMFYAEATGLEKELIDKFEKKVSYVPSDQVLRDRGVVQGELRFD